VRRLVRDGVDAPLASLFVTAARPIPPEAEGANRARSASEAFLYRRLETLAETRGRFQVKVDLHTRSTVGDEWKSISCALIRDSSLRLTALSISRIQSRTARSP